MPMIDVYANAGMFTAFIHDLPPEAISTASGRSNHVCVQVLTPAGVPDRDKQLGVATARAALAGAD